LRKYQCGLRKDWYVDFFDLHPYIIIFTIGKKL